MRCSPTPLFTRASGHGGRRVHATSVRMHRGALQGGSRAAELGPASGGGIKGASTVSLPRVPNASALRTRALPEAARVKLHGGRGGGSRGIEMIGGLVLLDDRVLEAGVGRERLGAG